MNGNIIIQYSHLILQKSILNTMVIVQWNVSFMKIHTKLHVHGIYLYSYWILVLLCFFRSPYVYTFTNCNPIITPARLTFHYRNTFARHVTAADTSTYIHKTSRIPKTLSHHRNKPLLPLRNRLLRNRKSLLKHRKKQWNRKQCLRKRKRQPWKQRKQTRKRKRIHRSMMPRHRNVLIEWVLD